MDNKLTVFCAVWHMDKKRESLLRGHMKCLDDQETEVNRIYVFDGNDTPPDWLKGEIIICKSKLTIYEAWNLALPLVKTSYVMNLNLDDRLVKSASTLLIETLESGADLVGGEWEICFSQDETDNGSITQNIDFHPEWPPVYGNKSILGSGSGQRGTYGPACAWRMNLHANFPRYPNQFTDGSQIRIIGDLLWWILLSSKEKKLVRIKQIIGKYHSHPEEQAEFRGHDNELSKFQQIGAKII
jgi:hypothetical protein